MLAVVEDNLQSAEIILTQLNDDSIKAYLLFLKYSLNFFNHFNALFQSRKILIYKLFINSQQLIRQIGQNFMIPEALKDITTFNDDEHNIQQLTNIYVGPECEGFLASRSFEFAQQIRLNCLNFYKIALNEMLKRLPYKDVLFEQLNFLEAKVALYNKGRLIIKDLSYIATRVENIDVTKLAFKWRVLPTVFSDSEKINLASLKIDKMWAKILDFQDFNGEKMFPNLELLRGNTTVTVSKNRFFFSIFVMFGVLKICPYNIMVKFVTEL